MSVARGVVSVSDLVVVGASPSCSVGASPSCSVVGLGVTADVVATGDVATGVVAGVVGGAVVRIPG